MLGKVTIPASPPKEPKFWIFNQNNSGGYFDFDEDDGITHNVVVEAYSYAEAVARAKNIGIYFDGCATGRDCDCCGDRWSDWEEVVDPDKFTPMEGVSWNPMEKGKDTCIHCLNGDKIWGDFNVWAGSVYE